MQLKILIVDDHALFSSGAAELIQSHFKAKVDQISDPTEVLKLEKLDHDLIISDIDMPQMNGVELIERVKDIHPSIKVLSLIHI